MGSVYICMCVSLEPWSMSLERGASSNTELMSEAAINTILIHQRSTILTQTHKYTHTSSRGLTQLNDATESSLPALQRLFVTCPILYVQNTNMH